MDDLIQVQLIGDVRSWLVVGLDRRRNVRYGPPRAGRGGAPQASSVERLRKARTRSM
jgi:hypothetical protein